MRKKVGSARILAVLDPRSNTMKLGVMGERIGGEFERRANWCSATRAASATGIRKPRSHRSATKLFRAIVDAHVEAIARVAKPGDHVLVMSNGGFGGIHEKLLTRLARR